MPFCLAIEIFLGGLILRYYSVILIILTTPVIYAVDILDHRPWYCCYLTADFVYYWHVALLLTVKHAYIQYIDFIFEHCNSSIDMSWNTAVKHLVLKYDTVFWAKRCFENNENMLFIANNTTLIFVQTIYLLRGITQIL
jgi:hypothetical protein